jgi:hypothetical protein
MHHEITVSPSRRMQPYVPARFGMLFPTYVAKSGASRRQSQRSIPKPAQLSVRRVAGVRIIYLSCLQPGAPPRRKRLGACAAHPLHSGLPI